MICALTGLDVANASMYDGASGGSRGDGDCGAGEPPDAYRGPDSVHPETIAVLEPSAKDGAFAIDVLPTQDGVLGSDTVRAALTADHAGAHRQQPSFIGTVQDLAPLATAAHDAGALAICATDLHACALLTPPGESGFDVAVGDGQPLGSPSVFGGPHVGFMAVSQAQMRRIPDCSG